MGELPEGRRGTVTTLRMDLEHASLPKGGEDANGDGVVVRRDADRTLFGVIDSLGHGPSAAKVTAVAIETLDRVPLAGGIRSIMEELHRALHGTRGAAATLCLWGPDGVEGCGVGNVEIRAVRGRIDALLTPGVLGQRMREPRIFRASLSAGDRLVIFSDGISNRVSTDDVASLSLAETCHTIMRKYRRVQDDATVMAAELVHRH